jgi:predicted XRE-type DNA-binding protein
VPDEPQHVTTGSVFDDLGFDPQEASILKLKADLYRQIIRFVTAKGYTPRELEKLLDEPQPRISEFLTGKIANISIKKLLVYATKLGLSPEIKLKRSRAA